jgi:hypothetical protein
MHRPGLRPSRWTLGLIFTGVPLALIGQDPSPAPAPAPQASSALDEALDSLDRASATAPPSRDLASYQTGTLNFRLLDISLDVLAAAGTSSERDESLESLQGGGHDPRKRGVTLQNVELSLQGAVDPYFTLETHLIYFIDPLENESEFELEEAFITTSRLPFDLHEHGLEVELGYFFTEFGRINPRHPHAWEWLDQPIINTRLFGPDGMRGGGARIGWLTPLPWFSEVHLGIQNANGETMSSFLANDEFFEERPIGGRPFEDREVRSLGDLVYLARWDHGWDFSDQLSAKLGISGLAGPNATGSGGRTWIYGADCVVKWRRLQNERGWPFVIWQSEIARRDYLADDFDDGTVALDDSHLEDWGFYSQLLWGFIRDWGAGIRYEFADGSGESVEDFDARSADPFRNQRHRVSPLLLWQATEFSRLRMQYNWDHAPHLTADQAHSIWFGFEALIGRHPAHTY